MSSQKMKLAIKQQKVEPLIMTDLFAHEPSPKADKKDISVLRDLAKRVREIAEMPDNIEKIGLWKDHNSLIKTRPLVLCFPENAYEEIIPYGILQAKDPFIREYEWYLRSQIYHWEELGDDWPITSRLKVPAIFNITRWGVDEIWENPEQSDGAARFTQVIKKESDLEKLEYPKLIFYEEDTRRNLEYVQEILGDILDPYAYHGVIPMFFDIGMIGFFSRLRGYDQILIDMMDRPQWVHKAMDFLSSGTLQLMKDAEKRGLLGLNNADNYIGTGGVGYTHDLPQKDFTGNVRLKDLWGLGEAQDMTGLSPQMLDEFILPYQIRLLENFGLNYYGCCEDLSKKFKVVKKIPNLRRVTVSPWTDMKIAAQELEDKYVYVWKPNPSYLAMDDFDEELMRKKIKAGFEITRENIVEIIMKDTHTLRHDPGRMKKWARIAKELADEY